MRRTMKYTGGDPATVEGGELKKVNDGTLERRWEASTLPSLNMGVNRIGTPGAEHVTQSTQASRTVILYLPVLINEIGKAEGDAHDWIELRNVSEGEANLKKWELNVITARDTETNLVSFPDLDYTLKAGAILLIVNEDLLNTPLARGKNFGDADGMTEAADQENRGIRDDAMFYDAKGDLDVLPEGGNFLLVLRADYKEAPKGTDTHIQDITGTLFVEDAEFAMRIFLLKATPVWHGNVIDGTAEEDFRAGKVYERKHAASGTGEKDWGVAASTGIG